MSEDTNARIDELTALVNRLLRGRVSQTEDEDPHVTPRIPVTDLKMNYVPPQLNDSESTSATKPIDFYVHKNIQDNPGIIFKDDPEISFANTMRVLLSEIATTVTQTRLENLHMGMELSGRVAQIEVTESKPLMDLYTFDAFLASKKPDTRKRLVQPFRKRQQVAVSYETTSSNVTTSPHRGTALYVQIGVIQANGQPIGSENSRRGIQNPIQEPRIRANPPFVIEKAISAIIIRLKIFNDEGRAPISGAYTLEIGAGSNGPVVNDAPEPIQEETESGGQQGAHSGGSFKNIQASNRGGQNSGSGILKTAIYDPQEDWRPQAGSRPEISEQMCRGKELEYRNPDVDMPYDPPKRLYDFHGFEGCIHAHPYPQVVHEALHILVERQYIPVLGASILAVAKSSHFYQSAQTGGMYLKLETGLLQADRAEVQDQRKEIFFRPFPDNYTPGNEHKLTRYDPEDPTIQGQGPTPEDQQVAERWINNVEAPVELHREIPGYFGFTPSGTPDSEEALGIEEKFSVKVEILGVDSYSNRAGNPEPAILERLADDLEWAVLSPRDAGNGDLYRLHPESSRCPKQAHSPNRMVYIQGDLRSPELSIQTPRRGPIRLTPEQEGYTEGQTGAFDTNFHKSVVEICYLVPRPERIVTDPASIVTSDNGSARLPKRKIATHREQTLNIDGMADQRRVLQQQGLSDIAINIFDSNERCIKRRSRYYLEQQRFLDWRT
ncbi:hypothetical protein AYI69_g4935 [Smittium culicis]|uniref:Uncharacterized protein n=1 Tax=Smittium culicis TaxID=133412 RepID=A0A1R1Y9I8_9FUNG|nr:hypothetical protein AYI69_g4935 [Smittium culicis]